MNGTAMYDEFARHNHVPPLVLDAVAQAKRLDFPSTRPRAGGSHP
jgi:hypothetical protein